MSPRHAGRFAKILAVLSVAFTVAFPALVYFGRDVTPPAVIALLGVVILATRLVTMPRGLGFGTSVPVLAGIVFLTVAGFHGKETLALLYPTLVNGFLMVIFGITLWRPPSLAERLARLHGTPVSEHGVVYTRWVTAVWAGFFFVNGLVAAFLALQGNVAVWALYTGFLGYLFAAALMGAELIFRRFYKARVRRRTRNVDCLS